jgi:hypothetical protein
MTTRSVRDPQPTWGKKTPPKPAKTAKGAGGE